MDENSRAACKPPSDCTPIGLCPSSCSPIPKYRLQRSIELDRAFHALADPTRRALVARLSQSPAMVSELAAPLPMTLTAVVQHLRVLEGAGLIASSQTGRVRTCRLNVAALKAAEGWIAERRQAVEASLDRLDAHLRRTPEEPR